MATEQQNLTDLISSLNRFKKLLERHGLSPQDLYLHTPAMKPFVEFFTSEIDALNAKVHDLQTEVDNQMTKSVNPYYF